jgi:hypothetical protein
MGERSYVWPMLANSSPIHSRNCVSTGSEARAGSVRIGNKNLDITNGLLMLFGKDEFESGCGRKKSLVERRNNSPNAWMTIPIAVPLGIWPEAVRFLGDHLDVPLGGDSRALAGSEQNAVCLRRSNPTRSSSSVDWFRT